MLSWQEGDPFPEWPEDAEVPEGQSEAAFRMTAAETIKAKGNELFIQVSTPACQSTLRSTLCTNSCPDPMHSSDNKEPYRSHLRPIDYVRILSLSHKVLVCLHFVKHRAIPLLLLPREACHSRS